MQVILTLEIISTISTFNISRKSSKNSIMLKANAISRMIRSCKCKMRSINYSYVIVSFLSPSESSKYEISNIFGKSGDTLGRHFAGQRPESERPARSLESHCVLDSNRVVLLHHEEVLLIWQIRIGQSFPSLFNQFKVYHFNLDD